MSLTNTFTAQLEHLNISVNDPDEIAQSLCALFDWSIRWSGKAMDDGYTVHVGSETSYLALYKASEMEPVTPSSHRTPNKLNHIGIVVDNLNKYSEKAKNLGFEPFSFSDYGACKSFYIKNKFNLELEVICYV